MKFCESNTTFSAPKKMNLFSTLEVIPIPPVLLEVIPTSTPIPLKNLWFRRCQFRFHNPDYNHCFYKIFINYTWSVIITINSEQIQNHIATSQIKSF